MGLPQNSSPIMAKIKSPESPNHHSVHRDISRSFWPIYDPAVLRAALSLHYRQLAIHTVELSWRCSEGKRGNGITEFRVTSGYRINQTEMKIAICDQQRNCPVSAWNFYPW